MSAASIDPARIRPLRRAEYERLAEAGMFDGEKLELLFGRLVRMSPQGTAHYWVIDRLWQRLGLALDQRAKVRTQAPFLASDDSEPEPDLAVVPAGEYLDAHPSEAWLIVEVADSSLADDRRLKVPLYAAARVPELWIVCLPERCVEVYREPEGDRYLKVSRFVAGDSLSPLCLPGEGLAVLDILPPR